MARRKKRSYKLPPTRMLNIGGSMNLGMNANQGFAHEGYTGMTNFQQYQTPTIAGNMDRTTAGSQVQGSPTVYGVGPNSRYIDFKNFQPDTFIPTYINNNSVASSQFEGRNLVPLNNPNANTKSGRASRLQMQNAINAGVPIVQNVAENTTEKESVNTFSSEIDPAEKSEFKNEVINEVMNKMEPQNKLEELYKPS